MLLLAQLNRKQQAAKISLFNLRKLGDAMKN